MRFSATSLEVCRSLFSSNTWNLNDERWIAAAAAASSLSSFVSIWGDRLDKKATIVSFLQCRSSLQRRQRKESFIVKKCIINSKKQDSSTQKNEKHEISSPQNPRQVREALPISHLIWISSFHTTLGVPPQGRRVDSGFMTHESLSRGMARLRPFSQPRAEHSCLQPLPLAKTR